MTRPSCPRTPCHLERSICTCTQITPARLPACLPHTWFPATGVSFPYHLHHPVISHLPYSVPSFLPSLLPYSFPAPVRPPAPRPPAVPACLPTTPSTRPPNDEPKLTAIVSSCGCQLACKIFFAKSIPSVCIPSFFPGVPFPPAAPPPAFLPRPPTFFVLNADLSACKTTSLSVLTS